MIEQVRERLEKQLTTFAAADADMLRRALALAEATHAGQYRKPSAARPEHRDPYLIHPMRVALVLLEEVDVREPAAVAAALLHDVVEDSDGRVTDEMIARDFGPEVAAIVAALTKPPHSATVPREQQLHDYHENIAAAPLAVRAVKLADRLDNIREAVTVGDARFQRKYLAETREIYLPLAAATDNYFHSTISEICDRIESMLA